MKQEENDPDCSENFLPPFEMDFISQNRNTDNTEKYAQNLIKCYATTLVQDSDDNKIPREFESTILIRFAFPTVKILKMKGIDEKYYVGKEKIELLDKPDDQLTEEDKLYNEIVRTSEAVWNTCGSNFPDGIFHQLFKMEDEEDTTLSWTTTLNSYIEDVQANLVKIFQFEHGLLMKRILFNSIHYILCDIRKHAQEIMKSHPDVDETKDISKIVPLLNEFASERIILLIVNALHYFTGISFQIYFDSLNYLVVEVYGVQKILDYLAQKFNYSAQLKALANYKVYNFEKNIESKSDKEFTSEYYDKVADEYKEVKNLHEKNICQLEDCNENDPSMFPPFIKFNKEKKRFFRKYDKQDLYHDCYMYTKQTLEQAEKKSDEEKPMIDIEKSGFICRKQKICSIFRNIDELRLLYFGIFSIIEIHELNKCLTFYEGYNIIRDEEGYKDLLKDISTGYCNILETKRVKKNNNIMRNFYGETVAYYFVFITHYMKWLLFPTFMGILFTLSGYTIQYYEMKTDSFSTKNIKYIVDFIFTILIILWGALYVRSWDCNQQFYNIIWGMNEYPSNNEEMHNSTVRKAFIFLGIRISISDNFKKFILRTFGYFITILMSILTISVNVFLFYITYNPKNPRTNKFYKEYDTFWLNLLRTLAPVITVIFRHFLSQTNYTVVRWVVDLENYLRMSNYTDAYILKIVFFEFWNYYFYLFYIAYAKVYMDYCLMGNCYYDLGYNLAVILITSNVVNLIEIFIPWLLTQKSKLYISQFLEKRHPQLGPKDYIYIRKNYEDSLSYEYIDIILNYGYVMLFGITCPLCFILNLMHVFVQRLVDANKLTKLMNVNYIQGSSGIGMCHTMLSVLTFIGIISNVTLIFFTSDSGPETFQLHRWPLVFAIENILAFIFIFAFFNSLPAWFEYHELIKYNYVLKALREDVSTDYLKDDLEGGSAKKISTQLDKFVNKAKEDSEKKEVNENK